MTSKQAMLKQVRFLGPVLLPLWLGMVLLPGCVTKEPQAVAPYDVRRVWAVAPLRNESGVSAADGMRFADKLVLEFGQIDGLDVLPLNRTLAAMQKLGITEITRKEQALQLKTELGVFGLVAGTITAYDPYDPPALGVSLELYAEPLQPTPRIDPRAMTRSSTDAQLRPYVAAARENQPVAAVSVMVDAASRQAKQDIGAYAQSHGSTGDGAQDVHLYFKSMDLFTDYVSHRVGQQLIWAEQLRVTPPPAAPPAPAQASSNNPSPDPS